MSDADSDDIPSPGCSSVEIRTRRFLLRDFVAEDVPDFEAYHNDPRSLEYSPPEIDQGPQAVELVRMFMTWAIAEPRLNYQFAIVHRRPPNDLIGCGGIRSVDTESGEAELGLELAPQFWGRTRYAIEILYALANFGFRILGLQSIFGTAIDANHRLGRLVSAFGATAVTIVPTPEWMVEKGWKQIRWQIARDRWQKTATIRIVKDLSCDVECNFPRTSFVKLHVYKSFMINKINDL
jgi:RimJ/RimL family protein N-acetyltransferase